MTDINKTLEERGSRYGEFARHAAITQTLKTVVRSHSYSNNKLTDSHKEALDMILHKIGRIVNGDPYYADSWVDIAGYAQLIVKDLEIAEAEKLIGTDEPSIVDCTNSVEEVEEMKFYPKHLVHAIQLIQKPSVTNKLNMLFPGKWSIEAGCRESHNTIIFILTCKNGKLIRAEMGDYLVQDSVDDTYCIIGQKTFEEKYIETK